MYLRVAEIFLEASQWRWTLVVSMIVLSVFQLCGGDYLLRAPQTHVALTGDISVSYQVIEGSPTLSFGVVQLLDISDESSEVVRATRNLPSTTSGNIYFECSYFDHEGKFEFRILSENDGPAIAYSNSVHVFWPDVRIASPQIHVAALTSDVAVTINTDARLCSDMSHNRYETTVALVYHGVQRSTLTSNELPTPAPNTGTVSDTLPTGEIGSLNQVQFYCDYIDRAGYYTFEYQSTFNRSVIAMSTFLEVFWSDAYKISSPQEDVFPCNPDIGFEITYEYPRCRGDKDKVRVFGQKTEFSREPAPGTLEYITEEGAYDIRAVDFLCEHFTSAYKGYCFTYVSVARSGAVDDHVMTCIPTNGTGTPLNGAWSLWSSWGDCTVSCGGGVRYRYRLCNNPSPVNGGASCLGDAVDSMECPYLTCPTDIPELYTYPDPDKGINVIPGCNCGCVLRDINGTISSSPGSCTTGFGAWKVLVADGLRIQLDFRSFDLYLHDEWLRIRDGSSEHARVVAYHTGSKLPASIKSTNNELYLEYKVIGKETNQPRGFSAVYLTFACITRGGRGHAYKCINTMIGRNENVESPVTTIPVLVVHDKAKQESSLPLGSVTNFVLILGVFFCTFVIILSVVCTGYAGWKRKHRTFDGREDSGLTACRSSASGHSIERTARGVVMSESSASELSTFSNNKRGCPDGRFIDRSSLYMVKDETGLTYLPESNLSSPSHTDVDGKQMKTIPEVPHHSPYTEEQDGADEELTRCEVTLPYHLGPGSVDELSDRHTVKSDRNTPNLAMKSSDKQSSSRSSHQSVRGSQNSVYGSRSHRSGSSSRMDHSDGSASRRLKVRDNLLLSPVDPDVRMLDGSEHPDNSHVSGARRKRRTSPSGSHNSHSNHSHRSHGSSHTSHHDSHRSSQTSHNDSNHSSYGNHSHRRNHNGQQGHHDRNHHGNHKSRHHRSRHSGDFDQPVSGSRRKQDNIIFSDIEPRPPVAGESPTTQGPRHLPSPPSRKAYEQHNKSQENLKEPRTKEQPSRYNGVKRNSMPNPSSYSNEVFDIGIGTNLGPREPIWPGKSPSTEGASDTNSRGSRNSYSSNRNRLETTADIELSPSGDGMSKKRGKHKKSRHKRDLKEKSSVDDDPVTPTMPTRLDMTYNNNELSAKDHKTDSQTDSLYSEPSMSSPLHTSYLHNRQRPDYMKSVFISDESLARTYSGGDSAQTSRTTTPRMSHRKLPDTPSYSGVSSPSQSMTCVPVYSDGVSVTGLEGYEFDDFTPNLPGAYFDYQTQLSPTKKLEKLAKPDKGEAEKQEVIKVNGINKEDKVFDQANSKVNGTKPVPAPRRSRPPRGPLSSASLV